MSKIADFQRFLLCFAGICFVLLPFAGLCHVLRMETRRNSLIRTVICRRDRHFSCCAPSCLAFSSTAFSICLYELDAQAVSWRLFAPYRLSSPCTVHKHHDRSSYGDHSLCKGISSWLMSQNGKSSASTAIMPVCSSMTGASSGVLSLGASFREERNSTSFAMTFRLA